MVVLDACVYKHGHSEKNEEEKLDGVSLVERPRSDGDLVDAGKEEEGEVDGDSLGEDLRVATGKVCGRTPVVSRGVGRLLEPCKDDRLERDAGEREEDGGDEIDHCPFRPGEYWLAVCIVVHHFFVCVSVWREGDVRVGG